MSITCTNRIWDHSKQSSGALNLMLALADYADDAGFAFPGIETLAAKTRMSSRQTHRLIAQLRSERELLVFNRPGRGNLYVVLPGTDRSLLSAALEKVARFGAAIPELALSASDRDTLQRTLKALSEDEDPLTSGAGTPDIQGRDP